MHILKALRRHDRRNSPGSRHPYVIAMKAISYHQYNHSGIPIVRFTVTPTSHPKHPSSHPPTSQPTHLPSSFSDLLHPHHRRPLHPPLPRSSPTSHLNTSQTRSLSPPGPPPYSPHPPYHPTAAAAPEMPRGNSPPTAP